MKNNLKINKSYLNKQSKNQISDFFENNGFVQLLDFFENIDDKKIKENFNKSKFSDIYKPLETKKQELNLKELFEFEIIQLIEYFRSKEFLNYIENICSFELNFNSIEISRYKSGDYLILNDNQIREEVIEIIFDLSDEFEEKMGGLQVYTTKEEEVLYLEPQFNALTILYKPQEIMKYLKYINNLAKNKEILRFTIKFDINED